MPSKEWGIFGGGSRVGGSFTVNSSFRSESSGGGGGGFFDGFNITIFGGTCSSTGAPVDPVVVGVVGLRGDVRRPSFAFFPFVVGGQ